MAVLAIAVIAGGCSVGQPSWHSGPYRVESASDKLLLTIYTYGGMTAAMYSWAPQEAQFSLYGDGRVIQKCESAQAHQMYPLVVPCLNESHVSPDDIQRIVAAADDAGLMSDAAYDDYLWTDDETTVFRTTADGTTHRVEAYALSPDYPSTSEVVKAARQRLIAFRSGMADLGGFLGRKVETQPYAAASLRIRAYCMKTSGSGGSVGSGGQLRTWPLSADPTNGGKGLTLAGKDMATFVAAAAGATVFTGWTVPGGTCELSAHPLLPGE
jgi:hypothetical protein